jgi:hypothetical protein
MRIPVREQPKECAVGVGTQRSWRAKTTRLSEQLLDLIVTEDVRNGTLASATEEANRRNLVLRVLGPHEASEAYHDLKSVMALGF